MALAMSSLKVSIESIEGRTRDCCIVYGWEDFLDFAEIFGWAFLIGWIACTVGKKDSCSLQ
jgi:hypothetical protein